MDEAHSNSPGHEVMASSKPSVRLTDMLERGQGTAGSWTIGTAAIENDRASRSSPTRTVAGALKKLFRLSDKKSSEDDGFESPRQHISTQPVGKPKPLGDYPKPASLKHSGSLEPASVLDYEDRLTGSTAADRNSAITDRSSVLTDRSSVATTGDRSSVLSNSVVLDRSISLQHEKAAIAANLSRAHSRSSGSSKLGTYLRNIIKSSSNNNIQAMSGSPGASGPLSTPQPGASSPQQSNPPAFAANAVHPIPSQTVTAPITAPVPARQAEPVMGVRIQHASSLGSSSAAFFNLPQSLPSPSSLLHPLVGGGAQRAEHEYPTLPPPSPAAMQRMQRDPNLLTVCNDLPPRMDRPRWRVNDYKVISQIHNGYASAVFKAHCKHSGQTVALKVYQPAKLHIISQFQLYREARLHCQMNHPNIIKLYAAFRHGDTVVLVQEFADGGDLLQLLLQQGTRLSERRASQMVLQPLLRALYYLHSRCIVHRDVKLENILFHGKEMTLKLADFGLCLNLREERSVTRAGTLDYMAPEVLRCPQKHKPQDNKERVDLAYNITVDIWALGVVAYELLNGCPPFTCTDKKETEKRIMSGLMPEFAVDTSEAAKEFVFSCLARKSDQRPTAWQLLRNPWLKRE